MAEHILYTVSPQYFQYLSTHSYYNIIGYVPVCCPLHPCDCSVTTNVYFLTPSPCSPVPQGPSPPTTIGLCSVSGSLFLSCKTQILYPGLCHPIGESFWVPWAPLWATLFPILPCSPREELWSLPLPSQPLSPAVSTHRSWHASLHLLSGHTGPSPREPFLTTSSNINTGPTTSSSLAFFQAPHLLRNNRACLRYRLSHSLGREPHEGRELDVQPLPQRLTWRQYLICRFPCLYGANTLWHNAIIRASIYQPLISPRPSSVATMTLNLQMRKVSLRQIK